MRRVTTGVLAGFVVVMALAGRAQERRYTGLETVRAVEVGVALVARDGKEAERAAAREFDAADLRLLLDGVEVPATSLEEMASGPSAEPWQFLIYVDSALSSSDLIARSAAALGARAEALVELGTVELVVADPVPRRVLAPTRDPSLVDDAVSGMALRPIAGDALVGLRARLRSSPTLSEERVDLARELLREEIEVVRRQQDRLLSWLATNGKSPSRRALFLISGGFDLRPEAFYAAAVGEEEWPVASLLRTDYSAVTGAVAGYGWVAVVLQRPTPDPLPRRWGLRRQLLVRLDGNWDPEKGEAELDLGESLIRQKKWKRAEAALERAVFAFHDQPKLRGRQAHALSRLGYVLERQERTSEATRVYGKALELDPSLADRIGPGVAGLLDPLAPLAELAEGTSGGIVRDDSELGRLLEGLRHRSRLTFQLAGTSDTGLHRVELSPRSGEQRLLAPQWVRSATPEAVSTARARRLLDEELEAADDPQVLAVETLSSHCTLDAATAEALVEVEMVPELPAGWEGVASVYRVSVALPIAGSVRVDHRTRTGGVWAPGRQWRFAESFAADDREPFLALIVEEVNTGRWFGSLLECEEAS